MQRPLSALLLAPLLLLPDGAAPAATPARCSDAVQAKAAKDLAELDQRQLRELEKRQQREALVQQLQAGALRQYHCTLNIE